MSKQWHIESKSIGIIYALYALSYYTIGITFLLGLAYAYFKKGEFHDERVKDHLSWQIKTFWETLMFLFAGIVVLFAGIGWYIILIGIMWNMYCIARGIFYFFRAESPYREEILYNKRRRDDEYIYFGKLPLFGRGEMKIIGGTRYTIS